MRPLLLKRATATLRSRSACTDCRSRIATSRPPACARLPNSHRASSPRRPIDHPFPMDQRETIARLHHGARRQDSSARPQRPSNSTPLGCLHAPIPASLRRSERHWAHRARPCLEIADVEGVPKQRMKFGWAVRVHQREMIHAVFAERNQATFSCLVALRDLLVVVRVRPERIIRPIIPAQPPLQILPRRLPPLLISLGH